MRSKLSRVVSVAAVVATEVVVSMSALAMTTADYVQDGLVAMWDAYENVGPGQHEDAPTEWIDIVGGAKLTVGENEGFDGCEFILDALVHQSDIALFDGVTNITLEVNGRPTWFTAGSWNASFAEIPNIGGFGWDSRNGAISIYRVDSATATQLHYITYNSGYSTIASLVNANLNQTYSARLGINASSVFVNGEPRAMTSGMNWTGNTRSSSLLFQTGSSKAKSRLRNIRVYAGSLTPEQIAQNRAVDEERFDNGHYGIHATLTGGIFEYDGEAHPAELYVSYPTEDVTREWSVNGGAFVAEQPAIVDPGVYTVQCRLSAGAYPTRVLTTQVTVFSHAAKISAGSLRSGDIVLDNFVALVRLSADLTPGFKPADAAAGGADVRFYDFDGVPLAHEIDTWATDADPAGTNLVWVLLPQMDASTVFYVTWGYGDGAPLIAYEPTKVWGDYVAVWHLNEASGTCSDATGRGTDAAVTEGYEETSIATNDAPFGGAARVCPKEGVYLTAPDYTGKVKLPDAYLYVSGWYKVESVGNRTYPSFWAKRSGSTGYSCNFQENATQITIVGNESGYGTVTGLPDMTKAGWSRVTAVYLVGGWDFFYLNGALKGSKGTREIGDTTDIPVRIGGVKGLFDEVRIKWAGPERVAGTATAAPVERIEQAEYDQVVNPLYYTQLSMSEDKSKIANAVTGTAVQRTVTVNGAMAAIGSGETTVQLLCGGAPVGEPMAVTEIGPFSLVVDVSAHIGFDTNSVFAVRMVNGETVVTTGTVEVKPVDTAVYTWTQGGDDDEWCNPANWSTPTPDRKDYPQDETAAVRFVSSSAEEPWQVHLDRSVGIGDVILTNGNVHVAIRADSTAQQLRMRPAGYHFIGESNVIAFTTVKLIPDRVTSGNANINLGRSTTQNTLILDGVALESWSNELYVNDLVVRNSTFSSGGLHVEGGDLVIDGSAFSSRGIVIYGKIKDGVVRGGHLTVCGKGAKVTTDNIQTWYTGQDVFAEFCFEVPEGGFTFSPVVNLTSSASKFFHNSAPVFVSVDPESPVFATNLKAPIEQRLICAAGGFNSSRITVRELPKRFARAGSAFYWMENGQRYADIADTRKDFYLTVATPKPGMKLIFW